MEEKKITENNIPEEKLEKVTGGIVDDSLEKVPEKKVLRQMFCPGSAVRTFRNPA